MPEVIKRTKTGLLSLRKFHTLSTTLSPVEFAKLDLLSDRTLGSVEMAGAVTIETLF